MREKFDWSLLSMEDWLKAKEILKLWSCQYREDMPKHDLCIAPDGKPYLWRWHVIPRNQYANVYFHIQVADDPERPLHDHPWDNCSVILSGGYTEILCVGGNPEIFPDKHHAREKGHVIYRRAEESHRLLMKHGARYTMTLFTTGPKIRDWGFWYPKGWKAADLVTTTLGNKSIHVKPEMADAKAG